MTTLLKRICLIAMVVVPIIGATAMQALPAKAVVYDAGAIRQLQERVHSLKSKENTLLVDFDEIKKQLDDLQRRNDPALDRRINELTKQLDSKYSDLQRVRLDLRDLEIKLL